MAVVLASGASPGGVRLLARGGARWSDDRRGGPGTVYVETAGQAGGGGTIRVDNDWRSRDERIRAHLPGSVQGEYAGETCTPRENFARAALLLQHCGWLELTADIHVRAVTVDSDSRLFLAGHVITTKAFLDNGKALAPGTYTAAQLDRVADDGLVVVLSTATLIMVR